MAIVDIVQRTPEWFIWRSKGITASMIPVIMGLSPYQTPYQLWAELVGLKQPDDLSNNYHVQRGVQQEPEARGHVENEFGRPYMPVCVEADHNPIYKASLDGLYTGDIREVLEIKCPCKKIYDEILAQQAKAINFQMYAAQVQWQLNAADAQHGFLYFYLRGNRPISTKIKRNDSFIAKAEKAALEFWNLVQTKTPPQMIEGRDKVVYHIDNTDSEWNTNVIQYKDVNTEIATLEAQLKELKSKSENLENYFKPHIPKGVKSFDKDGVRATKVDRVGSINNEKLLAEISTQFNIDIPNSLVEKCRNQSSTYYRFTVNNDEQPTETVSVEPIQASQPESSNETTVVQMNQPTQNSQPVQEVKEEKELVSPMLVALNPDGSFAMKSQQSTYF